MRLDSLSGHDINPSDSLDSDCNSGSSSSSSLSDLSARKSRCCKSKRKKENNTKKRNHRGCEGGKFLTKHTSIGEKHKVFRHNILTHRAIDKAVALKDYKVGGRDIMRLYKAALDVTLLQGMLALPDLDGPHDISDLAQSMGVAMQGRETSTTQCGGQRSSILALGRIKNLDDLDTAVEELQKDNTNVFNLMDQMLSDLMYRQHYRSSCIYQTVLYTLRL